MQRKPRLWVKGIVYIGIIASIVFFAINIYTKFEETLKYQTLKTQQEEKIEQLQEDEKLLKEEKEKLENPDYILRYARGKFLLTGEGETIIKLPANR